MKFERLVKAMHMYLCLYIEESDKHAYYITKLIDQASFFIQGEMIQIGKYRTNVIHILKKNLTYHDAYFCMIYMYLSPFKLIPTPTITCIWFSDLLNMA